MKKYIWFVFYLGIINRNSLQAQCSMRTGSKHISHRQWVFSIPKRLRIYFLFDRSLLSKLSQRHLRDIRAERAVPRPLVIGTERLLRAGSKITW